MGIGFGLLILVAGLLIVVLGFAVMVIVYYNRFQRLKNGAEATLGQIKVALKKRLDMLTELLESVQSYARFERETLENVTRMRTEVLKVSSPEDVQKIDRESRRILGNIMVAVENYPDLKTSQTVQKLMDAVREVEDEIARHRYTYNNIVQEFNTKVDTIPSNIVAAMFGFDKMGYLEFEEDITRRPDLRWSV